MVTIDEADRLRGIGRRLRRGELAAQVGRGNHPAGGHFGDEAARSIVGVRAMDAAGLGVAPAHEAGFPIRIAVATVSGSATGASFTAATLIYIAISMTANRIMAFVEKKVAVPGYIAGGGK